MRLPTRMAPHRSFDQTPVRSVREDWRADLPETRQHAFAAAVRPLETSFGMLSVAVDEAFGLRRRGTLVQAREQVGVTVELARRSAEQLLRFLRALRTLARRTRHYPSVVPLDPENFRWPTLRRLAAWEGLVESLLPTSGLRFRSKLAVLGHLIEYATAEFRHAAREISEGSSVHPESHWEALDALHYDLNSCLGEILVVTKSLLRSLPDHQLAEFRRVLEGAAVSAPGPDARLSHSSI